MMREAGLTESTLREKVDEYDSRGPPRALEAEARGVDEKGKRKEMVETERGKGEPTLEIQEMVEKLTSDDTEIMQQLDLTLEEYVEHLLQSAPSDKITVYQIADEKVVEDETHASPVPLPSTSPEDAEMKDGDEDAGLGLVRTASHSSAASSSSSRSSAMVFDSDEEDGDEAFAMPPVHSARWQKEGVFVIRVVIEKIDSALAVAERMLTKEFKWTDVWD
ncbi:hypothetical protein F5Y15DRAFT_57703 [Xylariaceae sp. FL0016]|nr:hypothetical protein F5Y15DRAFT_57703 [Xylariaceae sp. FL0016]